MSPPALLRRARAGRPLVIYEDGRQTRDYVFVSHAVRAILQPLAKPLRGLWIELGQAGPRRPGRGGDGGEGHGSGASLDDGRDVSARGHPSPSWTHGGARRDLGFAPAANLEDGLRRMVGQHEEA